MCSEWEETGKKRQKERERERERNRGRQGRRYLYRGRYLAVPWIRARGWAIDDDAEGDDAGCCSSGLVVVQMRGELSTAAAGQSWSRRRDWVRSTWVDEGGLKQGSGSSGRFRMSGCVRGCVCVCVCARVRAALMPAPEQGRRPPPLRTSTSQPATAGPQDLDLRLAGPLALG